MNWSFIIAAGLFALNPLVQAADYGGQVQENKNHLRYKERRISADEFQKATTHKSLADILRDFDAKEKMIEPHNDGVEADNDDIRKKEAISTTLQGVTEGGTSVDASSSRFTPAKPIDFFRDGIDKTVFEWFNRDHVQEGQVTCGFLYPKLGIAADEDFPTIKVKFCVRFAAEQPAPKGNLAVHCGGPGSLSDCNLGIDLEGYNIISFDQRGMGMSWPSFTHEECASQHDFSAAPLDLSNERSIQIYLDQQRNQAISCWACETCDFRLNSTQGTGKTYHFLEYSGTRQVAQDLDLFRQAIGAEKLSLYGVSYGTQIMATYATMFARHTDKFVVDANMSPRPDLRHMATIDAEKVHQRLSYMSYTCTMAEIMNPGSCPFDMNDCLNDVVSFYRELFGYSSGMNKVSTLFGMPSIFDEATRDEFFRLFVPVCDTSHTGNETGFVSAMANIAPFYNLGILFAEDCLQSYLPIYYSLVELLESVGTPSTGMASDTFALEFLFLDDGLDAETCASYMATNDTASRERIVYNFWEQNIEPLYSQGSKSQSQTKQKHQMQAQSMCTGPTIFNPYEEYLHVQCQDGTEEVADPNKPYYLWTDAVYLVHAQSQSGSTYDDRFLIQKVKDVYDEYGGSFYGQNAAAIYLVEMAYGYFWPKAQPIPPSGDTTITGIVAGQLYDPMTSYEDTQDMKMAFPATTLVTSQWVQHGLMGARANYGIQRNSDTSVDTCQSIIDEYFETGVVPVVDGFVCGGPLPNPFEDF